MALTLTEFRAGQAAPPRLSEKAFMAQVVQFAQLCGWLVYHTFDSRHSAAGFPDLLMVRGAVLAAVEIKNEDGKPTPAQRKWLWALAEAGAEVFVWKPSCWPSLERVLR